jgi:hypothetical protein
MSSLATVEARGFDIAAAVFSPLDLPIDFREYFLVCVVIALEPYEE